MELPKNERIVTVYVSDGSVQAALVLCLDDLEGAVTQTRSKRQIVLVRVG